MQTKVQPSWAGASSHNATLLLEGFQAARRGEPLNPCEPMGWQEGWKTFSEDVRIQFATLAIREREERFARLNAALMEF